jgi:hypothetical protein
MASYASKVLRTFKIGLIMRDRKKKLEMTDIEPYDLCDFREHYPRTGEDQVMKKHMSEKTMKKNMAKKPKPDKKKYPKSK